MSSITVSLNTNTAHSTLLFQMFLWILPHITTILITILIILILNQKLINRIIVIITVVLLYLPLYQSYVIGCVDSAMGTFLTKNTYSLAYNYITMQGDSAAVMVPFFEKIQNRGKNGTAKKEQIIVITWKTRQFKHTSN